ncbi:MAG: radical SAM protein [Planctomycetes bacterium]|nr:radical SAM protein [Planctomycetota bacterium]
MPQPAPVAMPYDGTRVPHGVIEVNQACNISCRACYKDRSTYSKPLAQILDEIGLLLSLRRVSAVTLAGGEPTLHPDLPAVMAHLRGLGVEVQMLTNGVDLTDERLRAYRDAGLSKLYLHIDSLQRRPDARGAATEADLDPLRRAIAGRVVAQGLRCGLVLTLYRRNLEELADVVAQVAWHPALHRLLVTCCTDFSPIALRHARPGSPPPQAAGRILEEETVTLDEVAARLLDRHGMSPYAYLPSERDDLDRRWIFYYAFAVTLPGGRSRVLHCGGGFGRVLALANAVSRRLRGRYPFDRVLTGPPAALAALLYAAVSLDPRAIGGVLGLLALALRRGARLDQKSFVFQEGPRLTAAGEVDACRACPDATVRNGRLVPVCLADILSPLE